MPTQVSQETPGETRREMKGRFDVVKEPSEERRRLQPELGERNVVRKLTLQ
jgi:hypothetical protein